MVGTHERASCGGWRSPRRRLRRQGEGVEPSSLGVWESSGSSALLAPGRVQVVQSALEVAFERTTKATESPKETIRTLADYSRDLWLRLNGGTTTTGNLLFPVGMPKPQPLLLKEERESLVSSMAMSIEDAEKQLQEASKAREARLRKIGFQERARVVRELKEMDDEASRGTPCACCDRYAREASIPPLPPPSLRWGRVPRKPSAESLPCRQVITLSRALAIRSLRLELEYIYKYLEDEALDVAIKEQDADQTFRPLRQGSSNEIALLVAEYSLLAEQLATLETALDTVGSGWVPSFTLSSWQEGGREGGREGGWEGAWVSFGRA